MHPSIGSVLANMARISEHSTSSYENLLREAAESKLYYQRDVHTPEEFEALVDQELLRSTSNNQSDGGVMIRQLFKNLKAKLSKIF